MELLGTENAFKVGEDIRRVEASGRDVIRLNLGEPDFNSAENINLTAKREIDKGNSHYTDPAGIPALRKAIAEQVGRSRGFSVDPNQVVVFPGAKPSIAYTMLTYVDPGDEVIYPSPGFPIYESWVIYVGAKPVPPSLDNKTSGVAASTTATKSGLSGDTARSSSEAKAGREPVILSQV